MVESDFFNSKVPVLPLSLPVRRSGTEAGSLHFNLAAGETVDPISSNPANYPDTLTRVRLVFVRSQRDDYCLGFMERGLKFKLQLVGISPVTEFALIST